MKIKLLSYTTGLFVAASLSEAAIIIPTVANSTVVVNTGSLANLTNGTQLYNSAITGTATLMTVPTGATLASAQAAYSEWDSDGHLSGFGIAESNSGQYIVWDLGADVILEDAILWKYGNEGGSTNHALNNFTFQYNTSAQGATTFSGATSSFNLAQPTTGTRTILGTQGTQAPQTFDLGGDTVRYVKMALISNHSAPAGQSMAFNEILFNAVPEPSCAMLIGLAGVALMSRRRRLS